MVVHEISDLVQMAVKSPDDKFKKKLVPGFGDRRPSAVLEQDTKVFIFGSTSGANDRQPCLTFMNYDHDAVMKYQDNCKAASLMASTLVHEMVHDPKNPLDNFVPFLYSNEESRLPTPIFNWYLCFLNLDRVIDFIRGGTYAKGVPLRRPLDGFCSLFLIRDMEDPMTVDDHQGSGNVRFENCRTRDCPLFCRSTPWHKVDQPLLEKSAGQDFEDATF